MSNLAKQLSQSHDVSAKVAQMLQTRVKLALERYSERVKQAYEGQLAEFEARLRREMLRDKLESLSGEFEKGAMPQIHVSVGQLAASRPAAELERVSGD